MPIGSNSNGSGPSVSHPQSPSTSEPEPVTGNGPFDLSEMERLANELFRELPGAVLPGLDAEQLVTVSLTTEAETSRSPAVEMPTPNGHVASGSVPRHDPAAGAGGVVGSRPIAVDGAAPERFFDRPSSARPWTSAPPPRPPVTRGGPLALTGDAISPVELGLVGVPRGAVEDPYTGSHYVVAEAAAQRARLMATVTSEDVTNVSPHDVAPRESAHPAFDVYALRADFPVLAESVHGRPLVWLDNGATTQKPDVVIERLNHFYRHENSNIHRGAHELAARATDAYEDAREKAAHFLHASSSDEVVFVRGTTEAINLVAQAWGGTHVGPGDEILITWLEHHANIVPWQQLCQATGARLCVAPVDHHGQVMLDEYERLLSDRTRIVAFTHVSNALGTITPAREMTELAHRYGARVLIDGAQAVSRMPVDVQLLDSDWYAFSGHKVFGPTGIGVLHGKRDVLNSMPPWQGGGKHDQRRHL